MLLLSLYWKFLTSSIVQNSCFLLPQSSLDASSFVCTSQPSPSFSLVVSTHLPSLNQSALYIRPETLRLLSLISRNYLQLFSPLSRQFLNFSTFHKLVALPQSSLNCFILSRSATFPSVFAHLSPPHAPIPPLCTSALITLPHLISERKVLSATPVWHCAPSPLWHRHSTRALPRSRVYWCRCCLCGPR